MQVYDIIMLVVLASAILFGAWKGLAWQVAALSSIFASYFLALRFREPVSRLIDAEPPWNRIIAMLILYVVFSLVIWILFGMIRKIIERVKLKEFDRTTGAVLGAVNGVILCVIITLFAVTLLGDEQKDHICKSRSGYYIARVLDHAHAVMPSEVHEVLHPYLHKLDTAIEHDHSGPEFGHDHEHENSPAKTSHDDGHSDAAHTAEHPHDATSGTGEHRR